MTELSLNQKEGLVAFRTIDPNLSEEDYVQMNIWYSSYWDTTTERLQAKLDSGRAKLYRNAHLICNNKKSHKAGNCYYKGSEDWSRQDSQPLTEQDISAIGYLSYGQETGTKNVAGDMIAHVTWACDSSD